MARNSEKREKWEMHTVGLEFGENIEKTWKMRYTHFKTWNMEEKHWKTRKKKKEKHTVGPGICWKINQTNKR